MQTHYCQQKPAVLRTNNNVNIDQQKSQDDNGVTRADEEATTSGQIVTSGLVDR